MFGMVMGYLLQIYGYISSCQGAIIPMRPEGLKGIFFSNFLHASVDHLCSNLFPVGVLSYLSYLFYPRSASKMIFLGGLMTGLAVWMLPPSQWGDMDYRYTCILGASGLVYLLAGYLFFSGIFRWDVRLLAVSLLVALYYGGMIWGIFPQNFFTETVAEPKISWQSHLSGGVVGVMLAWIFRKENKKKIKYIWQYPGYYNEKDEAYYEKFSAHSLPQDSPSIKENPWEGIDNLK